MEKDDEIIIKYSVSQKKLTIIYSDAVVIYSGLSAINKLKELYDE